VFEIWVCGLGWFLTFKVNRLILPGSLKKMLFFTLSPLTWECSMVTRQARGAVPLVDRERERKRERQGGVMEKEWGEDDCEKQNNTYGMQRDS
jgi:hypothetical protein